MPPEYSRALSYATISACGMTHAADVTVKPLTKERAAAQSLADSSEQYATDIWKIHSSADGRDPGGQSGRPCCFTRSRAPQRLRNNAGVFRTCRIIVLNGTGNVDARSISTRKGGTDRAHAEASIWTWS